MQKQISGGTTTWIPLKEISDLVADWHQNADIVNYMEHAGVVSRSALADQGLQVHFLPAETLNALLPLAYQVPTLVQVRQSPDAGHALFL